MRVGAATYSDETFEVFQGDEARTPRVLTDGEHVPEGDRDLVIEVPAEHRADFEGDLLNALRDIRRSVHRAGVPGAVCGRGRDTYGACPGKHDDLVLAVALAVSN